MEPTFCSVRLALELSPGFWALRLNRLSQPVLALVSVLPLAVDRHAVPALTLLDSTRVPVANLLVGLVVSAVNDATVAAAVKPHSVINTAAVRTILAFMTKTFPMGEVTGHR